MRHAGMTTLDRLAVPPLDRGICLATEEVATLADQIEQLLDPRHYSLLHRLRLAAETVGAMRAAAQLQRPG